MEVFKKKKSAFGVYSIYDPAVKDSSAKFSPPFFSPSDEVACSALLETLRRHNTSFEAVLTSKFIRMELWRCGSFDLFDGKLVVKRSHCYRVCKLSEYVQKDFVRNFMSSMTYPTEQEILNRKDF